MSSRVVGAHIKELCFVRINEQRISTAPNRYFFNIFVYFRDNVVKFAGGEPKEEFGNIHMATC